jgi:Raf kinase inhibitor-like YbhB/YbcL family protein
MEYGSDVVRQAQWAWRIFFRRVKLVMNLNITSTAFSEGHAIPTKHTCDGQNVSPPLQWSNVPDGAQCLALICEDPDAPSGVFTHWLLYNLPADVTSLNEGVPHTDTLNSRARQGKNDFQRIGYGGPCPPERDQAHRSIFKLYALDSELKLPPGANKDELTSAMQGHILASGQLMGTYKRAGQAVGA